MTMLGYRPLYSTLFALLVLVNLGAPINANSDNPANASESSSEAPSIEQVLHGLSSGFVPPAEDAPRRTTAAGSRKEGQCRGDDGMMRALMPSGNYGLTVEERPLLFFEMPHTQAKSVLLAFQSASGDTYSEAILPITYANEQGLVQFQLPEEMAGLTLNENYQWIISVLCNGRLDPNNPLFSGWVQRTEVPPELVPTLAHASISEKINQLKELGYWYDMLPLMFANPAQVGE